jgi:lipoate---protein ligase
MYSKSPWRLIPLLEAPGSVQMALDRWLLQQHRLGKSPSILRFYTWSETAISLGYHQRHYPSFWQELTWQGKPIDLVRRPTGGRAVLHQGDLTYMVVTSGIPGSRLQVYQKISQFLIQGARSLGIDLHYGSARGGYIHNPSCFATATGADLLDSQGQKLIGSAQLLQGNAVLQHGSIILSPDPELFTQVFNEPPPQKMQFLIPTVVEALTQAAKDCFNIELISQPLSENEWQEVLNTIK